jgi:predicted AAA+ superfamily ATPase
MSGELATLLSGRYIELDMLPLSFAEYRAGLELTRPGLSLTKAETYEMYIKNSSFPYTLQISGQEKDVAEYLSGIYSSILLKDVVARLRISDIMMLESVTRFVFDNIGNLLSTNKIADTMTSKGRKIDHKTVEKHIRGLMGALVIYQAKRYNIKGKQYLASLEKYYLADIGLRRFLVGGARADQGHVLENIVYLELLRRGGEVAVGCLPDGEVDFVVQGADKTAYYQVAATALDENILKRELAPFLKIPDNHPKTLLTLDEIGAGANHDGIAQLNALDWLLMAQ